MINKIRLKIFTCLALIGLKLGFSVTFLSNYFKQETIIAQIKILFKKIKFPKIEKASTSLDIVFLAYLGAFQGNNAIQIIIAKILKERGHNVSFVICDIELPICETTDISTHKDRSEICKKRKQHMKMFFDSTDFKTIKLTDLVHKEEIHDIIKLRVFSSNKWNAYEESMLLRYFKVGLLDESNKLVSELRIRAKQSALISEKLGEALTVLNPDRVFFSHGTYTTRGPAKDILNSKGIDTISISRAKMAESQKFNWKTSGDWWDISNEWKMSKSQKLSQEELNLINSYLESRRNHEKDIIVYNFSPEESKLETLKKLEIDNSKKIYTLFTNVLWDAASAKREVVFKNPIDWTVSTIKYFEKRIDSHLIVRIHPAESIIGTNQPMKEIIMDKIGILPLNVTILDPNTPINSWSLLKITQVGLVHTSTVGLELALEGVPCICVSNTHYRGKGFTLDPENEEEYYSLINSEESKLIDKALVQDLALKYSYILFMKYQLPMPFFHPKSHIGINSFKFNDWKKIVGHPSINQIIESTENKKDFILEKNDVMILHNDYEKK